MRTILIVEDSDDDFLAISRVFNHAGLRNPLQRCSNGDLALDYLYRRGEFLQAEAPGLLLLDLNLPGTDGRQVLRAIKADPALQQIPVIVLTTSFEGEDVRRCYEAGADSYLFKPVDMAGFLNSIARLKENWRGGNDLDLPGLQ